MALSAGKTLSLAEFLQADLDREKRYELINGVLESRPSESDLNQRITMFLLSLFLQQDVAFYRLRIGLELVVSGAGPTVRVPDLAVLSPEAAAELEGASRSLLTADMSPPSLVIEVVSPGQADRDYRFKRSEYAARGIQEYWVIDPQLQKVTVFEWVSGFYEFHEYGTGQAIDSKTFPELKITAGQILQIS